MTKTNTIQVQTTVKTWAAFYVTIAKIARAKGVDVRSIEHRVNENGSVRIRYRVSA